MKQKIFNIIQIGDKSNRISRFFDIFITVTIFCNIAVIFRMLRVARIFHLFRLNAKYDSFNIITTVLYENEKRNQIISSVFIVFILMLASSLCMYSVEHEAQPTVFRNAFSGIWWSMSTLLTVGYGDIVIFIRSRLWDVSWRSALPTSVSVRLRSRPVSSAPVSWNSISYSFARQTTSVLPAWAAATATAVTISCLLFIPL